MLRHLFETLFFTRAYACCLAACLLALTNPAQAEVIFSSSFTQPEFSDGDVLFGGANPDTLVGQSGFIISDSAGVGTLTGPASGFQRAIFGWDTTDSFDAERVNTLPTTSSIKVSAEDLTFNPTGNPVAVFGLSNIDSANILGNSSLAMGVQFAYDSSDGTLYIDRNTDFTGNFDLDTGVASGEAFDLDLEMIPTGGGMYDIDIYVNGGLLGTSTGQTPDFSKGPETGGFIQGQTGPGAFSANAFHLEVCEIPEPTSLALLGLAGLGLGACRKR